METSWLIGAGTIVGLGLYLKSISDSKFTSARGLTEVNTELADSDKPSFSPLNSTNPEYYQNSKDWVNTFDTSCGWTDDEQYCPKAIVEAANCSTECTRPYYQTSMNLREAQGWSEWSSPQAGDCGSVGLLCSTALIAVPDDGSCPPIRARAKLQGGPIHTNNFTFEIEWQLFSFLEGISTECGGPFHGWNGAGWTGNTNSVTIDEVVLMGPAELSIKKTNVNGVASSSSRNLTRSGARGNRSIAAKYEICGVGDLTQSATYQRYRTDIDFSDETVIDDYAGAYELSVQLNIGRDSDPIFGEEGGFWDVTQCDFGGAEGTINITIPNFVFIGPPQSQCCDPLLLENRYEDPKNPSYPRDKFYYDKLEKSNGGGYKISNTNAWTTTPAANRCGNAPPQISCTSDTQSQTNNAETFFPRNGFMQW